MAFDYNSPAELFISKRKGVGGLRAPTGYRRFATAAEAIRFAVEEFPAIRTLGASKPSSSRSAKRRPRASSISTPHRSSRVTPDNARLQEAEKYFERALSVAAAVRLRTDRRLRVSKAITGSDVRDRRRGKLKLRPRWTWGAPPCGRSKERPGKTTQNQTIAGYSRVSVRGTSVAPHALDGVLYCAT